MKLAIMPLLMLVGIVGVAASAQAGDGYPVALRPGTIGSKLAPRYSPKGTKVALAPVTKSGLPGFDHRQGHVLLGPKATRGTGHLLVLARSVETKPFDLLWIDSGGDGSIKDDTAQPVKARTSRGSVYTSYTAELRVNHGSLETPAWEPYRINLWVAVSSEESAPAFIRYSRRGFLQGTVTLADTTLADVTYAVVVSDGDNDGVLGTGDWWALIPAGGDRTVGIQDSRKVGDFAWAGTKAYKLALEGTSGRAGQITSFDPGLTPEEDARKRDRYWDDKHAERAKTPVPFKHDIEAALKEARARGAYTFLDFETDWCGPCKSMDRWVYTAKNVVAAAKGIACIKVDGDKRKDLKATHKVGSFPTGILLDASGKEIARFTGYRTGTQMVAFFAKARADR